MKAQRIRRSPEQARAQLLAGLEAALEESDVGELTVEAVAARAGMKRPAFYHYYSGLDELLVGLLKRYEDEIRGSVDAWLEGRVDDGGDYRQATHTHLGNMFEVFREHRRGVGAVAQAASGSAQVFARWQGRVIDYFIDKTAEFIAREVARGRSPVDDPKRTARALILMNNGLMIDDLTRANPDDPAVTARTSADIWNATIYGRPDGDGA